MVFDFLELVYLNISLIVADVDGTLTDGSIILGENDEFKAFSAKDGGIIKMLGRLGLEVVFLTARDSAAVSRRARELSASAVQGIDDKLSALRRLLDERNVSPEHCAYIGDDLNDYAAMGICGFTACPADAVAEIREACDYVSPCNGGHGAVRDICEHILRQCGKYGEFLDLYGASASKTRLAPPGGI